MQAGDRQAAPDTRCRVRPDRHDRRDMVELCHRSVGRIVGWRIVRHG